MTEKNEKPNIPTKPLAGFMELLPAEQIAFDRMKETICASFERFGFVPLDTPTIERAEVLSAKAGGETEKQIYAFKKGENDLALRFDLTVPLARYVAEYNRELTFPFRRYAIGKVYRGESPQKGRFREFYQCDADVIGNGELAIANDAELLSLVYDIFSRLDIGRFVIRISNRKLISGLSESLALGDKTTDVLRAIDKLEKVGEGRVRAELTDAGISADAVGKLLAFVGISGTNDDMLGELAALEIPGDLFAKGVEELSEVVAYLRELGVPEDAFAIDLSIARGLDYYTGTVFETKMADDRIAGSVCSGGRYDNLAESFSSQKMPGMGISIGLTRLFSQLESAELVQKETKTVTKALVVPLVSDMTVPFKIASLLRAANVPTEVYLEENKMKNKLAYADKLGIPYVVLVGEDEIAADAYTLKDMRSGEQKQVPLDDLPENILV